MDEVLSVSALTTAIKKQLESRFGAVSVRGEVSNFKAQASGHFYFTLKDKEAQISAVLFKGNSLLLARLPKEGDEIVVNGELNIYAPRGNYQIIVREIQFSGVGELLLKLHELKKMLSEKGWFEQKHKKPLPKFPKMIGVVTSPTGAVIQDILTILKRRGDNFQLLLNPVRVQGEGAAQEIAKAIEQCNRYNLVDVLIVGRGGGSLEDLWAFNEEVVVRAIYESHIPIISAVGHETDFTLADLAADLRAPTPSAAAELVMQEKREIHHFLARAEARMTQHVRERVAYHRLRMKNFKAQPVLSSPYGLLGKHYQRFDDFSSRLDIAVKQVIAQKKWRHTASGKHLLSIQPQLHIQQLRNKLRQLAEHLKSIDPKNLLKKGYCLLFSEMEHSVILSSKELHPLKKIDILLHDGKARAQIL